MGHLKKRVHRFVLALTFDKPCDAEVALREAKDTIHGEHYTTVLEDGEPGVYLVKSIKPLTRAQQKTVDE